MIRPCHHTQGYCDKPIFPATWDKYDQRMHEAALYGVLPDALSIANCHVLPRLEA